MPFSIEAEKKQFVAVANISKATYATDVQIGRRSRGIFTTFARALPGRGDLPESEKESEINNLVQFVRRQVIYPLLSSPVEIAGSQDNFNKWHRQTLQDLKANCPIQWNHGSNLTVGMTQKLINLHCKDLWALNLIPENYSRFFHPIIDNITLGLLQRKVVWTKLNSYEEYIQLQSIFKKKANHQNTYPLALECWYWNKNR